MVRNALKSIVRFVRLLRHVPPENPAMGEINAAAKRAVKYTVPRVGGGGFHLPGTGRSGRAIEELVGNELADGHEKARKKTPPPRAR